jgi:hypothetical protein
MKKLIINTFCLLGILIFSGTIGYTSSNPLRVHPQNFRYFIDNSGKTIILSGSHTWLRKRINRRYVPDGWDLVKFNKYLDFLQYWNHNYIRLWMWEHEGDVDIWVKGADGKYDLSKLNQEYFDLLYSFVKAAESRGIYVGVMLFQGWSGCCEASKADWPYHPMNKNKNINAIDGDPEGINYGNKVHSLENSRIVKFQEAYVAKMINTLNGLDNLIWEIGNETIKSSIPWKAHITGFIKGYEKLLPKQHLILDGTGNGVGNNSITLTGCDVFSPCVVKQWAALDEPYIANPPAPDEVVSKPVILDNDHLGNHFLRIPALVQRQWTWKSFTRGNHPVHMDCYDIYWDGANPTQDHPFKGVATNPHYDPQRKSMGDILRYAEKMDIVNMIPVSDSLICSTTFCLMNQGKEYIIYQPDKDKTVTINLPQGEYKSETFNTIDSSVATMRFKWSGGEKIFTKPSHCGEDWVLYIKIID